MRMGMGMMVAGLSLTLLGSPALPTASGAVLCKRKTGALSVRDTACKRKETLVTAAEVGAVGEQGAIGPTGPTGPAGPGAAWALVNGDGTIAAQSGGISVLRNFSGEYYVTFPSDVTGKLIIGTSTWRSGLGLDTGSVLVGKCGGGADGIVCVANDTTDTVYVQTNQASNTDDVDRAFYVTVIE
jgi:hypothetical protein